MIKLFTKFVILLTLIVVVTVRFYHLGQVPTGLHADEAAYGYDAYSLLKTGRDMWGKPWPLVFKSYGEYKLNLPYLIAPAIKVFGLSTLSTRLPSALAGLGTTVVLFFLLQEYNKRPKLNLILTMIFATSPWAFGISRVFFESNVALFFFALGLYSRSRRPNLSTLSLALVGYFYAPYRFLSFLLLGLGIWEGCYKRKHLLLYFVLILPILPQFFSSTGLMRLKQESALRDFEHSLVINENRGLCGHKFCYLFWNKPLFRLEEGAKTALMMLSPSYLFMQSADNYIVPPSSGPYPFYLAPFYLFGIFTLLKKKHKSYWLLYLGSIALAAVGGKLSLYRNAVGLFLAFVPVALGVYTLTKKSRLLLYLFISVAIFFQARFITEYFFIYAKSPTFAWGSDAEFIARYIGANEQEYRTIVDKTAGDFGPLYYAFYNSYDPTLFRVRAEWTTGDPAGWTHVGKLGKIASHDNRTLETLLCEKASAPRDKYQGLYLTAPLPDFSRFATRVTYDLGGTKTLHEIYDLDDLFDKLMADNPANLNRLCPRETARW